MSKEPEKKYECGACQRVHDFHHRAEECCAPDVNTVWVCPHCEEAHDSKEEAADCCMLAAEPMGGFTMVVCPSCLREHQGDPMQQAAVSIAGHCTTCNPSFTLDQQFAIEDLHFEVTGDHCRLNA